MYRSIKNAFQIVLDYMTKREHRILDKMIMYGETHPNSSLVEQFGAAGGNFTRKCDGRLYSRLLPHGHPERLIINNKAGLSTIERIYD